MIRRESYFLIQMHLRVSIATCFGREKVSLCYLYRLNEASEGIFDEFTQISVLWKLRKLFCAKPAYPEHIVHPMASVTGRAKQRAPVVIGNLNLPLKILKQKLDAFTLQLEQKNFF